MVSESALETPWKALHPLSPIVNLVPQIWRVLRQAWPLLLALLWSRTREGWGAQLFDFAIVVFFFVATVGRTVRHWATLRYRVSEGRLEVRTGILYRQTRTIDPSRIQNVELTRNLFHRWTGLVEVRVETASGREIEGELSALSVAAAEHLVDELNSLRKHAVDESAPEVVLVRTDWVDLLRGATTTTRIGVLLVAVGILYEGVLALQFSDPTSALPTGGLQLASAPFVLALVTGSWLFGVGSACVQHYGFRLTARDGSWVAEEGLLTRRRVELPLSKVQRVVVSETLPRRVVGIATVSVETAAARSGGGGLARSVAAVPVVDAQDVAGLVRNALPTVDADPLALPLRPPADLALRRALGQATLQGLIGGALLTWLCWPMGIVGVLLVPALIGGAILSHRTQGYAVTERMIVARSGFWDRQTVVVARDKVQSAWVTQGLVLRWLGLARLHVRVAGATVSLPLMLWDEAQQLAIAVARA